MMPIHEIRDSLTVHDSLTVGDTQVYQRKINLQSMRRHTINHIDIFDDGMLLPQAAGVNFGYEFYISIFPIRPTSMSFADYTANAGPEAADDNVLLKAVGLWKENTLQSVQFPNSFLGASPTFTFYAPHIYLTLILHGDSPSSVIEDLRISIYIALDEKEVGDVEFSMACVREYANAQFKIMMSTGYFIRSGLPAYGNVFPSWRFGGMRAERMMRADTLADFWISLSPTDSEKMMNNANIRIYEAGANTMVTFDDAFGTEDAAKGGIPDWIRLSTIIGTAAPILPEMPPIKKDDNGNTLML